MAWYILIITGVFTSILFSDEIVEIFKNLGVKRELKKKGHTLQTLIQNLFLTTADDWTFSDESKSTLYYPVKDNRNIYFDYRLMGYESKDMCLNLYNGRNLLWSVTFYQQGEFRLGLNNVNWDKELVKAFIEENSATLKHYLDDIVQTLEREDRIESEKEKSRMETNQKKRERELFSGLQGALSYSDFWENSHYGIFRIKKVQTIQGALYTLYVNDICVMTLSKTVENITHRYHNDWTIESKIVRESEKNILRSLHEHIKNAHNKKLVSVGEKEIFGELNHIKMMLEAMQNEAEWLNEHQKHLISYTYPNDIMEWESIYRSIEDKEELNEAKRELVDTLIASIQEMKCAVQENKKQFLLQKQRVIKERTHG